MEETFKIPARPWGEAEVKFLVANADLLDEATKAELGLTLPIPDNNFQADFDAGKEIVSPVVETGLVDPVGVVPLVDTPIEKEVPDVVIDATPSKETKEPVVENKGTDKA